MEEKKKKFFLEEIIKELEVKKENQDNVDDIKTKDFEMNLIII